LRIFSSNPDLLPAAPDFKIVSMAIEPFDDFEKRLEMRILLKPDLFPKTDPLLHRFLDFAKFIPCDLQTTQFASDRPIASEHFGCNAQKLTGSLSQFPKLIDIVPCDFPDQMIQPLSKFDQLFDPLPVRFTFFP